MKERGPPLQNQKACEGEDAVLLRKAGVPPIGKFTFLQWQESFPIEESYQLSGSRATSLIRWIGKSRSR